jgi:Malectin domain
MQRFLAIAGVCLGLSISAAAQQQPIRVHCGGGAYTDSKGQVWKADYGFSGGATYSFASPIKGATDPALFQYERFNTSPSLVYSFPVANGSYHVNLLFAEIYDPLDMVGGRVFNVKMQGSPVFQNLDIFAEAGADAALIKGAEVQVSNGKLTIEFDNVVQNAKVSAIEILPGPGGPALSLNFQYPDGTPVAGTLAYTVSSSLLTLKGSAPLTQGQVQAVLFTSPSALGISAQFQVNLSLTDTAGHVLWQLNLGMDPASINLGAVQSSSMNVIVQRL